MEVQTAIPDEALQHILDLVAKQQAKQKTSIHQTLLEQFQQPQASLDSLSLSLSLAVVSLQGPVASLPDGASGLGEDKALDDDLRREGS